MLRNEDDVRDGRTPYDGSPVINGAKQILGFDKPEKDVEQGTGQITTFNQLGFSGISDKPDGWYLPKDTSKVSIILETKSEDTDISDVKWEIELFKNIDIVATKYNKIIGILYNGVDVRVYKMKEEQINVASDLQDKQYYIDLYYNEVIDTQRIYDLTRSINNTLHNEFKMNDLKDRMIFTACALVVQRFNPVYGLNTQKGQTYKIVHMWISNKLTETIDNANENAVKPNRKLNILLERFNAITVATETAALNNVIDNICEISNLINSNYWNGEDVMAIFFNEFNRYAGKTTDGQVFTPEHIASLMYRLIEVSKSDYVLDAACGSGTFLVKAMSKMIKEAGGYNTKPAKDIMDNHLFGIEFDPQIYALACANMLIHKDGKTNLEQLDSRKTEAGKWIADKTDKKITKVLMNPPFERTYGCLDIVKNVMDHVPSGTKCAFILPDHKLEKDGGKTKLLKNHTLNTIIKLPENLFDKGVTTSIFIFETGKKHEDRNIKGYYIEDDGLETVKNKGRQDIKNRWNDIEDYWVKAIQDDNDYKYNTRQLINPKERLSYKMPEKPFEIYEEDFFKTIMDYEMYKRNIDVKEFGNDLLQKVLYSSDVKDNGVDADIVIKDGKDYEG